MKRFLSIVLGVLLIALGAFFLLNNYIYQQKQSGNPAVPYEGTLTGEYVCLPHKDTRGPQTLECAFGLRTDTNEYYALTFKDSRLPDDITVGTRAQVSGTITPVEILDEKTWDKYDIVGVISDID